MNILTVPQFALLKYAWRNGSFTVAEMHSSGECGDVTPDTIRSTAKRVCDKGLMVEIREKGKPPRYGSNVSKQDYYICLAKALFSDAQQEDKEFFKWAIDQI